MSWDGSGAMIVRFRNGNRIVRVSPDTQCVEQQDLHKAVACHTLSLPLLFTEVLVLLGTSGVREILDE